MQGSDDNSACGLEVDGRSRSQGNQWLSAQIPPFERFREREWRLCDDCNIDSLVSKLLVQLRCNTPLNVNFDRGIGLCQPPEDIGKETVGGRMEGTHSQLTNRAFIGGHYLKVARLLDQFAYMIDDRNSPLSQFHRST